MRENWATVTDISNWIRNFDKYTFDCGDEKNYLLQDNSSVHNSRIAYAWIGEPENLELSNVGLDGPELGLVKSKERS